MRHSIFNEYNGVTMVRRSCGGCNKETCRLCWLFNNDSRYNKLWGGDGNLITSPFTGFKPAVPHNVEAAPPKPCGCGKAGEIRAAIKGLKNGRT